MCITIDVYAMYAADREPVLHRRGEKRYIIVSIVRPRANSRIARERTSVEADRYYPSTFLARAFSTEESEKEKSKEKKKKKKGEEKLARCTRVFDLRLIRWYRYFERATTILSA